MNGFWAKNGAERRDRHKTLKSVQNRSNRHKTLKSGRTVQTRNAQTGTKRNSQSGRCLCSRNEKDFCEKKSLERETEGVPAWRKPRARKDCSANAVRPENQCLFPGYGRQKYRSSDQRNLRQLKIDNLSHGYRMLSLGSRNSDWNRAQTGAKARANETR